MGGRDLSKNVVVMIVIKIHSVFPRYDLQIAHYIKDNVNIVT